MTVKVSALENTVSSTDNKNVRPLIKRQSLKKNFKETLDSTGEMKQLWIEHTKSLKRTASKFSQSIQDSPPPKSKVVN